MRRHWALVIADFRRDYGISADQLYDLPTTEFVMLLGGLDPDRSILLRVIGAEPQEVSGEAAAALFDSL